MKEGERERERERERSNEKRERLESIVFILYTFVIDRIFRVESENLYSSMHEEKRSIYNN